MERVDEHRSRVPLVMLDGNIGVLLGNEISVQSIRLREIGPDAFVLTIQMTEGQKLAAKSLGFRTTPVELLDKDK